MGKIIELPEHIVSQIAAGEVIERPAYAVKELLENAIDAGATQIKIDIEQAGLKKIVVIDNGVGMDKADLSMSFRPHTTSKLENLSYIKTHGFRGEALSSIAAISTFTIASRRKQDKIGYQITNQGETLSQGLTLTDNLQPIGMPPGTVVTIQNLFSSVPARKKYLKSEKTEFRHIIDVVTHLAMAYPKIRFQLINNGKQVFDLPQNQTAEQRVASLMSASMVDQMIPVKHEDSYITTKGFIAKPQYNSTSQTKQFTFVNNRFVTDQSVATAVKEAYGVSLPYRTQPIFILFITLPHDTVDVNVHPRKERIKFIENKFVFDSVKQAVAETLAKNNLTFAGNDLISDNILPEETYVFTGRDTESFAGQLLKELVKEDAGVVDSETFVQIHNCYIVTQSKQGLLVIDQHAAHERILYEQFLEAFQKQMSISATHQLTKSQLLELSISDAQIIEEHLTLFTTLGFEIEPFGENTYKIVAVPKLFKDRKIAPLILEALDDLRQRENIKDIDSRTKKLLAYLACRSAIKAEDKLTNSQMANLVQQLESYPVALTCPHGRPIKVEINQKQLAKAFKR